MFLGLQGLFHFEEESGVEERVLSSGLTHDYPSYHEDEIILTGNESMVLSNQIVGNITLSGNSSVKVIGETLVNGIIHLSGNSTLQIRNTRFDIKPPPISVNDIVCHIQGTSRLLIQSNSRVTFHPQPIMKLDKALRNNASFVEVDDQGEIMIEDSQFSGYLPGDVIYEATKVTAGTFLITGHGKFTAIRSTVNCYLNYTLITNLGDPYVEMERWFWISSQRFGTIRIENTTCTLHEPGQTIFKPTNGNIVLKNSTIYGNVRPETISTFQIEDCEIYNVNDQIGYATIKEAVEVNDHAYGTILRTKLYGEMKLGWASTNEFLGTSDPIIHMEDCEILGEAINMFANTTLIMKDCEILEEYCLVEMADNTRLIIDGTDVPDLHINNGTQPVLREIFENIEIKVRNGSIGFIHHANIDRPITSRIDVGEGGYISDLDLWVTDPDIQHDLNLTLLDGGGVSINNSENWDIEVITRNSEFPVINGSRSLKKIERYYKSGSLQINGQPIEGAVSTISGNGIEMDATTGSDGRFHFIIDTFIEEDGEVTVNIEDDCEIEVEYLSFSEIEIVDTAPSIG
jgi:hypothetical protein